MTAPKELGRRMSYSRLFGQIQNEQHHQSQKPCSLAELAQQLKRSQSVGGIKDRRLTLSISAASAVFSHVPHIVPTQAPVTRTAWVEHVIYPILMPFMLLYLAGALVVAWFCTCLVLPAQVLSKRVYWCAPFLPYVWRANGLCLGTYMRLGFESTYCLNVIWRWLTRPLRPHLPDVYILGFPKTGTTSLANHLKRHPALSSMVGLPWHDVLSKETHYFNGVFGPHHAHSASLYRSLFPTVLTRWWAENVRGMRQWKCFDACPVAACLPHVARRIAAVTPHAKLIFMVRDPIPAVFSGEVMLRNLGFPLEWTLTDAVTKDDPRFQMAADEVALWRALEALQPDEPLPADLPELFYTRMHSFLRCGQFADRIQPFLQHFPRENIMVIEFEEFKANTRHVLEEVFRFIDVEPELFRYQELPAGMKTDYKGRRMHPSVQARLQEYFHDSNRRLCALLGRDFSWTDVEQ